jgi:hypothetical protein
MAELPIFEPVAGGWLERRRDHVTVLACAICGQPFEVPDIPQTGPIPHFFWVTPHMDMGQSSPLDPRTYHYAHAEVALWSDGPGTTPRRVWKVVR